MSQLAYPVYIVGAARTPTARVNASLASLAAVDLGAIAIKEAVKRSGVPPEIISDVYMGQVLQAGAGQAPAKQAAVKAGLPLTVEATTINKVCASGLKAVSIAAQNIQLGQAIAQVAGGMESMSQVPLYSRKTATTTITSSLRKGPALLDGLMDGLKSPFDEQLMGCYADQIAQRENISRRGQDRYALESYNRAIRAHEMGIYKEETVAVPLNPRGSESMIDDSIKSNDKLKPLSQLPPMFSENGTITAGNASYLSDGASAVVLVNNTLGREYSCNSNNPIARIVAFADASATPAEFALAPSKAIRVALDRAQLSVEHISLWEINEAFAVVVRLTEDSLGLNPDIVNVNGGAISFGHPLGNSGCRILISLLYQLKPGQYGVAAICNGGGGSTAMIIERMETSVLES